MVRNSVIEAEQLTGLTYYRGRVALREILRALGVTEGDEVAIQGFTCLAVPEGVMAVGARPVYIDIEDHGVNMDYHDLKRKLTDKVRAIVVQHTFGIPAEMDSIVSVAANKNIQIIEDCCHTFMSSYSGQRVGTFAKAAYYSFEWGKPLVAGVGGSAVLNDQTLSANLKSQHQELHIPSLTRILKIYLQYATYNLCYRPSFYWQIKSLFHWFSSRGITEGNYNPIQSEAPSEDFSLCMSPNTEKRLKREIYNIPRRADHARKIASLYRNQVNVSWAEHPKLPIKADVVFNRYPFFIEDKPRILSLAKKAGVEMAEWYGSPVHPLINDQWHLVHYEAGSCPRAEIAATKIISLPTHEKTSISYVDKVSRFFEGA
jgi:perosamine synthetase